MIKLHDRHCISTASQTAALHFMTIKWFNIPGRPGTQSKMAALQKFRQSKLSFRSQQARRELTVTVLVDGH
jgi:hypothetical protein